MLRGSILLKRFGKELTGSGVPGRVILLFLISYCRYGNDCR